METSISTEGLVDEALDFIFNLDIEKPWTALRKASDGAPIPMDSNKAGFINDGSLICFVDGLSPQRKKAVLNSCLLAQLAANKLASRWQAPETWYLHYTNILRMIGWTIDDCLFTKFEPAERTIVLQSVVLKELSATVSGREILLLQESMDKLYNLKNNDRRLVLFDTQTQALGRGNFQICTVNTDGEKMIMNFGGFSFSAMGTKTRLLWHGYNARHTEVWHSVQRATLDEEIYSAISDAINDKLEDSTLIYTGNL